MRFPVSFQACLVCIYFHVSEYTTHLKFHIVLCRILRGIRLKIMTEPVPGLAISPSIHNGKVSYYTAENYTKLKIQYKLCMLDTIK